MLQWSEGGREAELWSEECIRRHNDYIVLGEQEVRRGIRKQEGRSVAEQKASEPFLKILFLPIIQLLFPLDSTEGGMGTNTKDQTLSISFPPSHLYLLTQFIIPCRFYFHQHASPFPLLFASPTHYYNQLNTLYTYTRLYIVFFPFSFFPSLFSHMHL